MESPLECKKSPLDCIHIYVHIHALWLQAGGGVQLCPDAQLDDGKLDVTYILNPELEDVPKILTGLQSAWPLLAVSELCRLMQSSTQLQLAAGAFIGRRARVR